MSQKFIDKDPSLSQLVENKKSSSLFSRKRLIYIISTVIAFVICYFVLGFIFINNSLSKDVISPNSIAVLPFKDFSPKDSQWFSDGVSDNILHSLAQMKDLSVISFTSSSTYRDTEKKIPEIAKELRVSYILEGSVTLVEGKIKIIAQLIDSNDKHIWSKEYDESFDNVIDIQKNVAQEVMQQLEITLSPREEVTFKKYPTKNMEAYSLFLKGQLINDSRKVEDLLKNIELNKQAIALDSNFAEAYAEIAHSYLLLGKYNNMDPIEGFQKAEYYADKALSINSNISRAWDAKGMRYRYLDWDKSKEYHEKAVLSNPNDALAHIHFANYFLYRPNPDIKKFLEELTVAQRLNPFSKVGIGNYLRALTYNNKIEEAEEYLKAMGFNLQLGELNNLFQKCNILANKNKNWTTVISFIQAKIKEDPNNALMHRLLGEAHDEVLNDNKSAIKQLEKAYDLNSTNSEIAKIYIDLLIEGERYSEANTLLKSEKIKNVLSKRSLLQKLWYSQYSQGHYNKAHEIANDSLLTNQYFVQVLTYAQLNDRKKMDSIKNKYYWGSGFNWTFRVERAILYAVLKERDSMYYYLNKIKFDREDIRSFNSRPEFDPYRNEDRYKAILRANYLPVSEE